MAESIMYPRPLVEGDKIAILSPAGIVRKDFVYDAVKVLSSQGWRPYIGKSALSEHGSFSGSEHARFQDFSEAVKDPETRAVFCSRGGYGCVQLLEMLETIDVVSDPKWIVGFSDVSVLHAFMLSKGIAGIHASMAKHLSLTGGADDDSNALFGILRGQMPTYRWKAHENNRCGVATGRVVGGNLAVLQALINTPYDIFCKDVILFIEDIAEPIYKVERMLYQLRLNGVLGSLRGLIAGHFTQYDPDRNYDDMEAMIKRMTESYDYPVAMAAPIGHIEHNIPIVEGADAVLDVSADAVTLRFGDTKKREQVPGISINSTNKLNNR